LELGSKQLFVSRDVIFKESEFHFVANLDTNQSWFPDMPDNVQDQELQTPNTTTHTSVDTLDTVGDLESEESVTKGAEHEHATTLQEEITQEMPTQENTSQVVEITAPPAHVRRSSR
ncbi:hypothetical protein A4A49_64730, partial [Nicotiana attenuata]